MTYGSEPSWSLRDQGVQVLRGLAFFALFMALLWGIEAIDVYLLDQELNYYGIVPRTDDGLAGIFAAPFLHAGFAHLSANSIPFTLLGFFIFMRSATAFASVTLAITLLGGLGVWLFGASHSVHIGASGLIFGYLGFLLAAGLYERSLYAVAVGLTAAILYGSALWGVLPGQPGVSWEGHLFGFLTGIIMARFICLRQRRRLERLAHRMRDPVTAQTLSLPLLIPDPEPPLAHIRP